MACRVGAAAFSVGNSLPYLGSYQQFCELIYCNMAYLNSPGLKYLSQSWNDVATVLLTWPVVNFRDKISPFARIVKHSLNK